MPSFTPGAPPTPFAAGADGTTIVVAESAFGC